VHIDNAKRITEALGWDADFIRSDVLSMPSSLDGTADLVYTGRGAINWIASPSSTGSGHPGAAGGPRRGPAADRAHPPEPGRRAEPGASAASAWAG
jgi:hypothetical protein